MKWEQYMLESARTAPHTGTVKTFLRKWLPWYDRRIRLENLTHGALGIAAEAFEWFQTEDGSPEDIEEVGDMLWFVALVLRELGDRGRVSTGDIQTMMASYQMRNQVDLLEISLENVVSTVKAHRVYGRDLDVEKVRSGCQWLVALLADYIDTETTHVLGDVLDANIRKLRARFPDKFSTEKANNRDLEAEKEAMSDQIN